MQLSWQAATFINSALAASLVDVFLFPESMWHPSKLLLVFMIHLDPSKSEGQSAAWAASKFAKVASNSWNGHKVEHDMKPNWIEATCCWTYPTVESSHLSQHVKPWGERQLHCGLNHYIHQKHMLFPDCPNEEQAVLELAQVVWQIQWVGFKEVGQTGGQFMSAPSATFHCFGCISPQKGHQVQSHLNLV